MFNADDDTKSWTPYVVGMVATALLSSLASELVRWGVDELKQKYGTKRTEDNKPNEGDSNAQA